MSESDNDANDNLIDDSDEATIGMTEIDGFDFERAVMLMSVIEKVSLVAPKSTAILGCAQAALNEMNEEAKAIAKRRAEEFARAEAKAAAKAAADAAAITGEQEAADAEANDEVRLQPKQPLARAIPSQRPVPEVPRRV